MDKAMMSPDWKENYTALLAEVGQLTSYPSWESVGVRQHLKNILDSFRPPDERDWCAMHIEGHCTNCGSNRCSGCMPGPHTFSDAIDQSFRKEIRVIHEQDSVLQAFAKRYCEQCDHAGRLCRGGCDCSKNPLMVRKNNTISRLQAALEIVELETSRAFKYIKGAHSSPEIIRYLVTKLYACNDTALDIREAKEK